jgi:hypothetical protein
MDRALAFLDNPSDKRMSVSHMVNLPFRERLPSREASPEEWSALE